MNTGTINVVFRSLQLIPLFLVICPIFMSYWTKRNTINGLRSVRVVLLVLVSGLIFSNIYFIIFSLFNISRALPSSAFFMIAEKVVNLIAYGMLYWLFKHASTHSK